MNAPLPQETKERIESIVSAIQGRIDPVRTSMQYKLALLLATVVMVILPIIYVGLACAFAALVYFHAVYSVEIFSHVRGKGVLLALVIYVAPLFAGITAVVFMFRPLFSRRPKREMPESLTRDQEPVLFAFVDRLCAAVNAPKPRRIDVDCEVNASASFRRGVLSMILGRDLVLTIGMPLVAGMNVRQLGGILAHEFGHFSQGGGMRLSYIIRTISGWFTRVVYERDSWDINLERWSKENDIRIGIIFYAARGFVWFARKVLWVLMMIGHGVAGIMLRQMEFDADRHEVRFAGSNQIAGTTRRLHELMVAHRMAISDLSLAFQEERLADDVTKLISVNSENLPPKAEEYINKSINEGKTGWLDTHPCDRERIESGLRENARGIFELEIPASALFVDFAAVCRGATIRMYSSQLGTQFRKEQLQASEEIVRSREQLKASGEALSRWMQDGWTPLQSFSLPYSSLPADTVPAGTERDQIQRLRDTMVDLLGQRKDCIKQILEADSSLADVGKASLLLRANFRVLAAMFSQNLSSDDRVQAASRVANQKWTEAETDSREFSKAAEDRLCLSLSLISSPDFRQAIPESEQWVKECNERLLPAFQALNKGLPALTSLRSEIDRFMTCVRLLQDGNNTEGLVSETKKTISELCQLTRSFREHFGNTRYPFEHLDQDMTIAKFLCSKSPVRDELGATFEAVASIADDFFQLSHRVMGRLCQIAEEVERHLGLEPLPKPPE